MALRTRVKSRLTEGLPLACASATAGPRHVLIQTQRARSWHTYYGHVCFC